ncbi:MAG TPA: hypothetical protein VG433_14615, partial [Pirellulales bacterium]|nr:hypothetical protein [Pirellulales bacterium]
LAGDSLVLGPGPRAHIECPAGSGEILLYRQQARWFCRGAGPLEIDGRITAGGGPLGRTSRVVGPDFSFTLEEAG